MVFLLQNKRLSQKTNTEMGEERSLIAVRSVGTANNNKALEFLEVKVIKENYAIVLDNRPIRMIPEEPDSALNECRI